MDSREIADVSPLDMEDLNGRSRARARRILKSGTPELIAAVNENRMSLRRGAEIAALPPEQQIEVASKAVRPKKWHRPLKGTSKAELEELISLKTKELEELISLKTKGVKGQGMGIRRAYEAIACLKRISISDSLRWEGLRTVAAWIKDNRQPN